jgi:hypothetical protein
MKRPVLLTIAAVLVLVLVLLSAVWPMVGGNRVTGMAGGPSQGQMTQRTPPAGNFQKGTPDWNNNGSTSGNQGTNSNGTGTGQPGFRNGNRSNNRGGMMGLTRILQYCLYALEIVLGVIASIGLWMSKRWGRVLAIITAALVLVVTIPGMFRMFSVYSLIENLAKVILAVGIIVLVVLPKSKPVQAAVI